MVGYDDYDIDRLGEYIDYREKYVFTPDKAEGRFICETSIYPDKIKLTLFNQGCGEEYKYQAMVISLVKLKNNLLNELSGKHKGRILTSEVDIETETFTTELRVKGSVFKITGFIDNFNGGYVLTIKPTVSLGTLTELDTQMLPEIYLSVAGSVKTISDSFIPDESADIEGNES